MIETRRQSDIDAEVERILTNYREMYMAPDPEEVTMEHERLRTEHLRPAPVSTRMIRTALMLALGFWGTIAAVVCMLVHYWRGR